MSRKEYQKKVRQQRKSTHKRVEVQLTVGEYKAFEKLAKKENVSVNTLVKNMATAYRDTTYFIPSELKESLNQFSWLVRNIADNINQIAHRANLFEDIDEQMVFTHLAELDKQVKDFIKTKVR